MIPMAVGSALGAMQSLIPSNTTGRAQKFQQSFQQLGKDLQAGNLTQAQNDLSSAESALPPSSFNTQPFNQLAQDLKLRNLTAAQSDYATLQQTLAGAMGGSSQPLKTSVANTAATQAQQLSQAWTGTQQSAAQRAYTALRGEMAAYTAFGNASDPTSSSSTSGASAGLNVSV